MSTQSDPPEYIQYLRKRKTKKAKRKKSMPSKKWLNKMKALQKRHSS